MPYHHPKNRSSQDSAFTTFSDDDLNWDDVFAGADWFHFAGTAPAVAPQLVPVLKRACSAARLQGVRVSCDLNYRRKLWTPARAAQVMGELLPLVDVFVCGAKDAEGIFGIGVGYDDRATAELLSRRFGFTHVLVPRRDSRSATNNSVSALLWSGGCAVVSRVHEIPYIVDRIGAGDAMTAGIIYGLNEGWSLEDTVEFGAAACCLKHSIPGDFSLVSREKVKALAAGDGSGRIQR